MLKDIPKEQLYIILGLIASIIIGGGVLIYNKYFATLKQEIIIEEPGEAVFANPIQEETIIVHISGEVKKEGVYKLKKGDRVVDAIALAQGATDNADLSRINLAKTVTDGEKLIIPQKRVQIEKASIQTSLEPAKVEGSLIDLNSADEKTLCSIPGIGPSTAKKIIEYRDSKGSFGKPDDLLEVPGIGKKKFEKIKDKITVY